MQSKAPTRQQGGKGCETSMPQAMWTCVAGRDTAAGPTARAVAGGRPLPVWQDRRAPWYADAPMAEKETL
jgi:hypothetical protein